MARRILAAGNWKMNKTPSETKATIEAMKATCASEETEVLLCVPAIDIPAALEAAEGSNIQIGAENVYFEDSGAYTGEIAPCMLTDLGIKYVILGHSERREYFAETNETVNKKMIKCFEHGLIPIMCCGESLEQREQGVTMDFIRQQVKVGFLGLSADQAKAAVIAYEGIAFQHLAAGVMDGSGLEYLHGHLRILSGLYGVVRPFDGVVPYRLEMGAKLSVGGSRDLYDYWGSALYDALAQECDLIVNLASVEYAKAVTRWVRPDGPQVLTCLFGSVAASGRFVQRATEAKAARGTFVRWCAERGVADTAELRSFCERGYVLDEGRSSEDELVFVQAGN